MPIVNKLFIFVNLFTKLKLKINKTMQLLKLSTEEFVNLDASQVKFVCYLVELLNSQCTYSFKSIRLDPIENTTIGQFVVTLECVACSLSDLNFIQSYIDMHYSFHPICLSGSNVYFAI